MIGLGAIFEVFKGYDKRLLFLEKERVRRDTFVNDHVASLNTAIASIIERLETLERDVEPLVRCPDCGLHTKRGVDHRCPEELLAAKQDTAPPRCSNCASEHIRLRVPPCDSCESHSNWRPRKPRKQESFCGECESEKMRKRLGSCPIMDDDGGCRAFIPKEPKAAKPWDKPGRGCFTPKELK